MQASHDIQKGPIEETESHLLGTLFADYGFQQCDVIEGYDPRCRNNPHILESDVYFVGKLYSSCDEATNLVIWRLSEQQLLSEIIESVSYTLLFERKLAWIRGQDVFKAMIVHEQFTCDSSRDYDSSSNDSSNSSIKPRSPIDFGKAGANIAALLAERTMREGAQSAKRDTTGFVKVPLNLHFTIPREDDEHSESEDRSQLSAAQSMHSPLDPDLQCAVCDAEIYDKCNQCYADYCKSHIEDHTCEDADAPLSIESESFASVTKREKDIKVKLCKVYNKKGAPDSVSMTIAGTDRTLSAGHYCPQNGVAPTNATKSFFFDFSSHQVLFRYEWVEACSFTKRYKIGTSKSTDIYRTWFSMTYLRSFDDLSPTRRYVLLLIMMTLCTDHRVDFMVYDTSTERTDILKGSVGSAPWAGGT